MLRDAHTVGRPGSRTGFPAGRGPGTVWKSDDLVEGRVVRPVPPHHSMVRVQGKNLLVETPFPVKAGQVLLFQVKATVPRPVLRLVGPVLGGPPEPPSGVLGPARMPQPAHGFLRDLLKPLLRKDLTVQDSAGAGALARMGALLGRSMPGKEGEFSPGMLRTFLSASGLMWEQRLRTLLCSGTWKPSELRALVDQDLKGLALGFLQGAGEEQGGAAKLLAGFVSSLEQNQLLNQAGFEKHGRCFFWVPLPTDDGFGFAQVLVDLQKEGRSPSGEKAHGVCRLSLLLNMSAIGTVRADAALFHKTLRVGFRVSSEPVASLVRAQAPVLRKKLARHGIDMLELTCRVMDRSVLDATCLLDEAVENKEGVLHLVI